MLVVIPPVYACGRCAVHTPSPSGPLPRCPAPQPPDPWDSARGAARTPAGRPCAAHSTRARELARTVPGLTRPPRWLPVELSTSEEQIAKLASRGLTNRDIAGALGISPKTVENHLGNAFRELGITSRTDLPAIFRNSEAPGGSDER